MLNISIKEEYKMRERNFMGFDIEFEQCSMSIAYAAGFEGYPDIGDFAMLPSWSWWPN